MSEQDDNRKAQSEALGRALAEAMNGDRLHPDNQPQVGTCPACKHPSHTGVCPVQIMTNVFCYCGVGLVPQPTPAEPLAIGGIPVRLDSTFAKDEIGIESNGKIVARVKVVAEPRIETVPDERTAELPRDNRFHDPFEAGAQPEPEEVRYQHWAAGTGSANDPGSYEGWMARARAGSSLSLDGRIQGLLRRIEQTDQRGGLDQFTENLLNDIRRFLSAASPPSSPGAAQTCPSCPHPAHSGDVCAEKIMPGVFCYCGVSSPGADTERK